MSKVYSHSQHREADYAAHTNHNMEFLAFLAAVFLPLTFFTVMPP